MRNFRGRRIGAPKVSGGKGFAQPGSQQATGFEAARLFVGGERAAVVVAAHALVALVGGRKRLDDLSHVAREAGLVAGVLDHQHRLRDASAVLASVAFDDRPDQVESQLSGVHCRAKPTAPKFDVNGSAPHSEPNLRSDGSSDRSKQRKSPSVRQTLMIGVWAASRRSSADAAAPAALTRLRAAMRRSISGRAIASMRATRSRCAAR